MSDELFFDEDQRAALDFMIALIPDPELVVMYMESKWI